MSALVTASFTMLLAAVVFVIVARHGTEPFQVLTFAAILVAAVADWTVTAIRQIRR